MKKSRLIAALVICAIILAMLVTEHKNSSNPELLRSAEPTSSEAEINSASYLQAVEKIAAAGSYRMHISTTKVTTLGEQRFKETSSQILTCHKPGTPDAQIILNQHMNYGMHSFSVSEQYTEGTARIALENSHFSSTISPEDYAKRLIPIALMDPSRYNSVLVRESGDRTLVGFSDPKAPEAWAVFHQVQLIDASGRSVLDSQGNLLESVYTISYTSGPAAVTYSVTTHIEPDVEVTMPAPPEDITYVPIDLIDVPRLLEQSTGYLLQADIIHAQTQEEITCQANNLHREQTTDLSMKNHGEDLDITLGIDVDLVDYNQGGTSTQYHQTEAYKDGNYTLEIENQESVQDDTQEITAEQMKLYCQDILVGTIILPEYIESVSVEELDSAYKLTFTASKALSEIVCSDACKTLYQDPALLDSLATSYETNKIEATLMIDKYTGLPLSSGIDYHGSHGIDGTSYTLISNLLQTYDFNPQ